MKPRKLICLFLIYSICLSFFTPLAPAQNSSKSEEQNSDPPEEKGLQFRLRESAGQPPKQTSATPQNFSALTEPEANAIFRRLPEMQIETVEKNDLNLRPGSLLPPKTGNVIPLKFPADEQPKPPAANRENSAALEVARFSPTGKMTVVSDLHVTFSHPMIALSSHERAGENVPVVLTPQPAGKWRWIGTKTLVFDAARRFPMATAFTARIPAGTRSANGAVLEKEVSWTFSTAPPKVEKFAPQYQTARRDALLLAVFDQEIVREAVLQKISVTARGQKFPARLANQEEIEADEKIADAVKYLPPNRFIVFRAAEFLPPASSVNVNFESGLPSAEGDLTTTEAQQFSFKTFGELKFDESYCGYERNKKECRYYEDWNIDFNNQLDAKSFDRTQVKIEPPLEDAEISISGSRIEINGGKKNRTTYKVTVSGALRDEFGQTLGRDFSTEFRIGAETPSLYHGTQNKSFIVLDPHAKPVFSVYSVNYPHLKVKIYAVKPEDFSAFRKFSESEYDLLPTFGKLVFDKTLKIKSAPDERTETRLDLAPALSNGFGHAVLIVEPTVVTDADRNERIVSWFEATNIGVDAFVDGEQMTVFTSDLKTGKPLGSANVKIADGASGTTDESGIVNLKLPAKIENENGLLIARRGADAAILQEKDYDYGESKWKLRPPKDGLRWFVFNDRNMYRPNETVSIKGYIRRVAGGKFSDVGEIGDALGGLNYVLKDSRGNEILRGAANLNMFGAFDFQIKLPANLNLGYQRLELTAEGALENRNFTHQFQAQEFRRPEFEVSTKTETAAPFYVGDSARLAVEAKYYAGGFLTNAETNWRVTATPTNYAPPNRDDYTFGKFVPWWENYYGDERGETTSREFEGATDASGKHRVEIDFIAANPARPYAVAAEARVQDVNRQTFASMTELLVHPSELYVGVRTEKTFAAKNETFKVETITTDIDGNAVAGATVSLRAELKDWRQIKGEWKMTTLDVQTCQIKSANDAVACDFTAKFGGKLTITASVSDRRERRNESELDVWIAGASREPSRDVEQETAQLIPDKKEYAPSETAEILVNAPFVPAEGVLTLRRGGIVKTERFTMNEAATVLKIPIEENFLPNVHVQIDLVGASKRIFYEDERDAKLPPRPAFASGALDLKISTASRELNVTAEPIAKTLEPGGATDIKIAVKDFQGNAAADTEVAVVAVDESVLALTNYKIENPLDAFYPEIESGVTDYHSRENVFLAKPDDIEIGYGSGGGMGSGSGDGNSAFAQGLMRVDYSNEPPPAKPSSVVPDAIRIRRNFNALAIFSPSVVTDANGEAVVSLTLPDNLTRYRITAVAATRAKQFGIAESNLTARQPLIVRPSAPRFMNFGDKIELPVVVQNQTENPFTVAVAIRAANANLTAGNGRKILVPANDRVEVRFPVAAERAGTARFQIGATSGKFADAAEFELPVYTPATTETFAVYGTTDESGAIAQPIEMPENVFPQFGGLEVMTSSTQLQELTDAFIYLQNYPFECAEQIASRVLSVAALREVLQTFEAKDLPSKEQIEAKMKSDIERLGKLQQDDGGFAFWRRDGTAYPFVSVHVAHALARARQKGYAVPTEMIEKSRAYLKNVEAKYPNFYSPESQRAISAYAFYVRDLLGDKDAGKTRKFLSESGLENLSSETLGWILSVLAADKNSTAEIEAIKRHLLNSVTETAGAAHFVSNYKDGEYVLLSSDRRADGVILEALLKTKSASPAAANGLNVDDLIPKIVRGLLANRAKGRWANTQENVFVLLALDEYFQTYERATPNFVARVWFGNAFAGEQKFVGRSTDSNLLRVPMNYLEKQKGAANLILDKQGDGRIYYRIGLNYATKNLRLDAADHGFIVTRTYEAIDNPGDVRRSDDGSWTIRAGARVRVKIQMVAPTRRYHVALVDKLPAGLEIINSALAVSESVSNEPPQFRDYRSNWHEHQNLRDERAEVFAARLWEGVWLYSYTARATTIGEFFAPPAKAEEMYAPETFGRSAADFIRIQ